jgi:hypothetical protein
MKINPIRYPDVIISGHAIVDRGFFDNCELILRNSWGPLWCKKGDADRSITDYAPTEAWGVTLKTIVNDLPPAGQFHHVFSVPMARGDKSEEVKNLQIALMISKDLAYVQPLDRGYYGELTQTAVFKYQIRKGVQMGWAERYLYKGRYCGPKTLARLNSDFA